MTYTRHENSLDSGVEYAMAYRRYEVSHRGEDLSPVVERYDLQQQQDDELRDHLRTDHQIWDNIYPIYVYPIYIYIDNIYQ